jgi:hypothetical protein
MANSENDLVAGINNSFGLALQPNISITEIKDRLATYINELINHDFNKLVSLLYRIDINEKKLKQLLEENPTYNAGHIIADLIIERQIQKQKIRQQFRKDGENNIDENEKW